MLGADPHLTALARARLDRDHDDGAAADHVRGIRGHVRHALHHPQERFACEQERNHGDDREHDHLDPDVAAEQGGEGCGERTERGIERDERQRQHLEPEEGERDQDPDDRRHG